MGLLGLVEQVGGGCVEGSGEAFGFVDGESVASVVESSVEGWIGDAGLPAGCGNREVGFLELSVQDLREAGGHRCVTHMDNLVLHMENVQARSAPVTES